MSMESQRKTGGCRFEKTTYTITCKSCLDLGKKSRYYGETSKTPYLRGLEHIENRKDEKEDSVLLKHDVTYHEGNPAIYYMEMDKRFTKPLQRQIREIVMIDMSKDDVLMNSKGEWNSSRIPRVVVEDMGERKEKEEVPPEIVNEREEKMVRKARAIRHSKPRKGEVLKRKGLEEEEEKGRGEEKERGREEERKGRQGREGRETDDRGSCTRMRKKPKREGIGEATHRPRTEDIRGWLKSNQ